jgi:hypothetical protein
VRSPLWFTVAVTGLGAVAAGAVVGAPVGVGLTIVAWGVLGAWMIAVRRGVAWWVVAAALAAVPAVRAAGWVVWPCVVAAAGVASFAAAGGTDARQVAAGLVRFAHLPHALALVLRPQVELRGGWQPMLQGAGLGLVLLAVFVPLFASADAAFSHLLDEAVPDAALDRPGARAAALLAVVAVGGGLLHAARMGQASASKRAVRRLDRAGWIVPLAVLDALFAAFVALQVTALFAGHDHVLRTAGLTYAEYARQGFAQLMAAAALTLAVIAAADRWARREHDRLLHALLGALCLLTLVVLASALMRLELYVDAFGQTPARTTAQAAILWLGALFALLLAAGAARRTAWLPRAVVALCAGGLLAFAASDPERRIAAHNVDRYEHTGKVDPGVLIDLGPDAAPELARLPAGFAACVTKRIDRAGPTPWAGANVARARARDALAGLPLEGSCLAPR